MIPTIQMKIFGMTVNFQIYQTIFLILAALGAYLIFEAVKTKKNAKISPVIIPKETIDVCRDPKGMALELWKSILLLGITALAFGAYGVTQIFFQFFWFWFDFIGAVVFFLSLGWFFKEQKRCIEKFCR